MKKIKPELASGFRDYLPEDMAKRARMINIIRGVFELFGFGELETPGIEEMNILIGGDPDFKKQIFKTSVLKGDDVLALRFDLTVPLARVIAQYTTIKKPFKRFQIGKVWRAEKSQLGRFRELLQCDADIVGASSPCSDAEIITLAYETLSALSIGDFTIKINSRKILNALPFIAGFSEKKLESVLRIIDKLDKRGIKEVKNELSAIQGISKSTAEKILEFVCFSGISNEDTLSFAEKNILSCGADVSGVADLRSAISFIKSAGVPDKAYAVDLRIARGLGYYTGIVFETALLNMPEIGSVCSGGRYDSLVERFGNVSIPSVGLSIGFDRLFSALSTLNLSPALNPFGDVIVLNFDENAVQYVQKIATGLRKSGISTELYLGNEKTIKGQLAYALNKGFSVIVLAGIDEFNKRTVQIKDVAKRTQLEMSEDAFVAEIRKILKNANS